MIELTLILGFLGIAIFVIIASTYSRLLKNNENGFLHLLFTFMYICWMPIPLVVYMQLREYSFLFIGSLTGTIGFLILTLTMILQTSHLVYSAKNSKNSRDIWESRDKWMMHGLLGSQVELLGNILKGLWVISLTAVFYIRGDFGYFLFGLIFSGVSLCYIIMIISSSLVKEIAVLKKFKVNMFLANFETPLWIIVILSWLIIKF